MAITGNQNPLLSGRQRKNIVIGDASGKFHIGHNRHIHSERPKTFTDVQTDVFVKKNADVHAARSDARNAAYSRHALMSRLTARGNCRRISASVSPAAK
jgi:hypothetical protein